MTNSRVYLGSKVGGLMEKLFTEVWAGLMKTYRGWSHSSDLHRPRLKGKGRERCSQGLETAVDTKQDVGQDVAVETVQQQWGGKRVRRAVNAWLVFPLARASHRLTPQETQRPGSQMWCGLRPGRGELPRVETSKGWLVLWPSMVSSYRAS